VVEWIVIGLDLLQFRGHPFQTLIGYAMGRPQAQKTPLGLTHRPQSLRCRRNFQHDASLLDVIPYSYRNQIGDGCRKLPAQSAKTDTTELWRWSRLGYDAAREPQLPLASWPVDRPSRWLALVNEPLAGRELDRLRTSVLRGRPFGAATWTEATARRLRLQSSLRPAGRPRKPSEADDNQ